jgi:hypothetical protein
MMWSRAAMGTTSWAGVLNRLRFSARVMQVSGEFPWSGRRWPSSVYAIANGFSCSRVDAPF